MQKCPLVVGKANGSEPVPQMVCLADTTITEMRFRTMGMSRGRKRLSKRVWERLNETGAIFYNHKPRVLNGNLVTPFDYLPDLPIRQVVIWARAGGINFSPSFYVPTHEWVVILAKKAFRLRDKAASGIGDVWYIPQESNASHPAPFPLKLPLNVLETTTAQHILDPFFGCGTTAIACIKKGREFTGIELSPKYFEVACERIRKAYAEPDMFVEAVKPSHKQESLFVGLAE